MHLLNEGMSAMKTVRRDTEGQQKEMESVIDGQSVGGSG